MQDQDGTSATIEAHIGYNLKRVYSAVKQDVNRVLAAFDLRTLSYSALSMIVSRAGISQTELADAIKIERSNLVQIIDELAGRGLVARAPVAQDRRRHALLATPLGEQIYRQAHDAVVAHEERMFSPLSQAEREVFLNFLLKLRAAGQ